MGKKYQNELGSEKDSPIETVKPGKYGRVEIFESAKPPSGVHWGELDIEQYLKSDGREARL